MAAIQINNIQALIDDIERQKLRMLGQITAGVRAVAAAIFTDLVQNTPQYSGNLVLNWRIAFGPWTANYRQSPSYGVRTKNPYKRGDNPAVAEALESELFKLDSARWNSKIRITNTAPYADEVEAGKGPGGQKLRAVNLTNDGVVMASVISLKYQLGGAAVQKAIRDL